MNPYLTLLDRNDDSDEHARELACGMAVPYSPRRRPADADKWWNAIAAIDDHRDERRQLQAQLATERRTNA